MKEPKIRLRGFSGEWEETTIGKVISVNRGVRITRKDLVEHGLYPVYQNTDYPMGYFNRYNVKSNNPFVIIGGSAGLVGFSDRDFWAADDCAYFGDNDNLDKSYLYGLLLNKSCEIKKNVRGSSVPRLDRQVIIDLNISLPIIEEQQSIASYFQNLDSLIQSTTKKIESLKQVKAASLQSMFPQEGETTPRVRFKGFTKYWELCKLDSILSERHEASTITQELPQLSFTIADGVIRPEDRKSNKRDFLIKDKDNKRYLITRVGDIIYNPANVVFGAIHRNSLIDGVVSPIYRIFYTNQDSRFIECVVRRPSFISQLAMRTEGTVTKLKTLKPEAFLDMEVCIPTDKEEQKAIGEYFQNLEAKITLQTQRLEKLKQIKSACLDNMFV